MRCIVQQCDVTSGRGKSMYAPSKTMRLKWLAAIGRLDLTDEDASVCVCEDHFPPSSFSTEPKPSAAASSSSSAVKDGAIMGPDSRPRRRILPNAVPYIILPATALPISVPGAKVPGNPRKQQTDTILIHANEVKVGAQSKDEALPPHRIPMESMIGHPRMRLQIPSTEQKTKVQRPEAGPIAPSTMQKPVKRCIPSILTRPRRSVLQEMLMVHQGEMSPVVMDDGRRNPTTANEDIRHDHVYLVRPHDINMRSRPNHVNEPMKQSFGVQVERRDSRMSTSSTQTGNFQRSVSVTAAIPQTRSVGTQIITKYGDSADGDYRNDEISDDDAVSECGDHRHLPIKRTRYDSDYTVNSDDIEDSSDLSDEDMGPKQIVIPAYVDPYGGDADAVSCAAAERKFIVFERALDSLFMCLLCNRCGHNVHQMKKSVNGSCLTVNLLCRNGHSVSKWCSQPKVEKRPAGNLVSAAAISRESGEGFTPIKRFADYVGLCFMSKMTYQRVQKDNLFPIVKDTWEEERAKCLRDVQEKEVTDEEDVDDGFSPVQDSFDVEEFVAKEEPILDLEVDDAGSLDGFSRVVVKEELEVVGEENCHGSSVCLHFDVKDKRAASRGSPHKETIPPPSRRNEDTISRGLTGEQRTSREVRNVGDSDYFNTNDLLATNESFTAEDMLCGVTVKEEPLSFDESYDDDYDQQA